MDAGGRAPTVGALGDAGAVAEKYAWIKQHESQFSVKSMCRFMSVSRSAYYAWQERPQTATEKDDVKLVEDIKTLFKKSRKNYGTRRLKEALIKRDQQVSRKRPFAPYFLTE